MTLLRHRHCRWAHCHPQWCPQLLHVQRQQHPAQHLQLLCLRQQHQTCLLRAPCHLHLPLQLQQPPLHLPLLQSPAAVRFALGAACMGSQVRLQWLLSRGTVSQRSCLGR